MNKFLKVGLFGAFLAVVGCGSSDNLNVTQNPSGVASSSAISGSIRGENGTPLEGVRMVVMERTTSEQVEVLSRADGSFTVEAPSGVYDVALDLEGDEQTATAFYGPVVVQGRVRQDFQLPGTKGRNVNEIFGQIFLPSGQPAANRAITARPGFVVAVRSNPFLFPEPETTTTTADGSFTMQLDSEGDIALDLEIAGSDGRLREWLDMAKRQGKPCYVNLITDTSAAKNRLRCNQADDVDTSREEPLTSTAPIAGQASVTPFNWFKTQEEFSLGASLQGGELPMGTEEEHIINFVSNPPQSGDLSNDVYNLFFSSIKVLNKRWLFWSHSIYIKVPSSGEIGDEDSDWTFTDRTGDTYHLNIQVQVVTHRVSYNSKAPEIVKLTFKENYSAPTD